MRNSFLNQNYENVDLYVQIVFVKDNRVIL